MSDSQIKGNDPARWEKLLACLDEKLQLGLLGHLRKITSYTFEGQCLIVEPGSEEQATYLRRDSVFHHLELLAQDSVGIEKIEIRWPSISDP